MLHYLLRKHKRVSFDPTVYCTEIPSTEDLIHLKMILWWSKDEQQLAHAIASDEILLFRMYNPGMTDFTARKILYQPNFLS